VRQLLQALGPAALVQVEGAGLQAGAEAAADLVRGHLCHPEEMPQLNARLTTRLRGSGGPLPPFRDRFEPQKNDLGHHLTPEGVFFLPMIYFPLLNGDFVNGPTLSTSRSVGQGTGAFIYAQSAVENRAALAAPRHTSTALFSCRFKCPCPPRRQRYFHGNADRAYNTLHFAS